MADWFSQNAPSSSPSGGDWFAANAPKVPDAPKAEPPGFLERGKEALIDPIAHLYTAVRERGAPAVAHDIIGNLKSRFEAEDAGGMGPYGKAVNALLRPVYDKVAEDVKTGNYSGALGTIAGSAIPFILTDGTVGGAVGTGLGRAVAPVVQAGTKAVQAAKGVIQSPGAGNMAMGATEIALGAKMAAHGNPYGAVIAARGGSMFKAGMEAHRAAKTAHAIVEAAPTAAIETTTLSPAARGPVQMPVPAPTAPMMTSLGEMRSTSVALPPPAPQAQPMPIPEGTTTAPLPRGPMPRPTGTVPANPAAPLNPPAPTVAPAVEAPSTMLEDIAQGQTGKSFAKATPKERGAIRAIAERLQAAPPKAQTMADVSGDLSSDLAASIQRVKEGKPATPPELIGRLAGGSEQQSAEVAENASRVNRIARGNTAASKLAKPELKALADGLVALVDEPNAPIWKAIAERTKTTVPTTRDGRMKMAEAIRRANGMDDMIRRVNAAEAPDEILKELQKLEKKAK